METREPYAAAVPLINPPIDGPPVIEYEPGRFCRLDLALDVDDSQEPKMYLVYSNGEEYGVVLGLEGRARDLARAYYRNRAAQTAAALSVLL